ncbi:MAG: PH domain-containing protein [Lachnospiraceae bacterium]|nr:PH domain-containing protein [Lachnospiraceae bacterium]
MAKKLSEGVVFAETKRWLFLGLPFTFTKYIIKDDMITMDQGFLRKIENDCYMYKVQDVQHTASLMERIFGLGSITCFTGDTTHPKLMLTHIKHSKDIKNYILEASEAARMKRRTLNTLNIGADAMVDADDDM